VSVSEMTSAIDTITAIQLAIIEAKGAPQRVQQAKLNGCLNALFSIRLGIPKKRYSNGGGIPGQTSPSPRIYAERYCRHRRYDLRSSNAAN